MWHQRITRLLAAGLLAAGLAGCAQLQTLRDNIEALAQTTGSTDVSPKAAYVLRNAFVGVERTATNYLLLPDCPLASGSKACADPVAVARIVPFVRSGRAASLALKSYMIQHPDGTGGGSLYDELSKANSALNSILREYNLIKA